MSDEEPTREELLELLERAYQEMSHESDCIRRFQGAAECTCLKSEIGQVLADAGLDS